MIDQIPSLPPIPAELRLAAKEGRLVPFIGAGASMLAGCPSWEQFSQSVLDQLVRKGAINHSQADQIRSRHLNPRVQLSIARGLAAQKNVKIDYVAAIHPGRDLSNSNGRRLYAALGRLSNSGVYVTTNYDAWLDYSLEGAPQPGAEANSASVTKPIKRNIIHRIDDFSYHHLNISNTAIHLHGSLDDPNSMVVTTRDYLDRYRSVRDKVGLETNKTIEFLTALFNGEKVVLFIGYGLDELEILEYAIMKAEAGPQRANDAPKHYILQPYFSHELEFARHMSSYFETECGIELLPFSRDEQNYGQLISVVEYFADQMPIEKTMDVQRRLEMESLLNGS